MADKSTKKEYELRGVLAKNVRAFRLQKHWSQENLAEESGLHRTYIGSVERMERNVTLSTLETLASALDVTVIELLTKHGIDEK